MALRARRATILLTTFFSFACLAQSIASFTSILPRVPFPATMLLIAGVGGLALAAFYPRNL